MTANLKVMVPEGTTNYIQNPAFRYDTTGWNAIGSTLTRTLDYARFNIASLKVVTNGSVMREGAYYRVSSLQSVSEPIAGSVYVRGQGQVHIRLIDMPFGKEWVSPALTLRLDRWQRIDVQGFATGSNDVRLYVETDGPAKAITFYIDGVQLERKAYATSYCDGDQPECRWDVVSHGSNSIRDPYTRKGGKWVPLAGPCRWNDNIYVTGMGGFGMPPITNNMQSWANAPGSYFQNSKIQARVVTLNFTVKNRDLRRIGKPDLSPLHKLRQELIDVFKPDRTAGDEPFLFSYQEGDRELFIWLRYEAGLEGDWDIRNQWVNSFPVRFLAENPIFFEDSQDVKQLNFLQTLTGQAGHELDTLLRKNGVWQGTPVITNYIGLDGAVRCLARGIKGEVYAGGDFTVGGFINRIAKWDGANWVQLGPGGANGTVYSLAVSADGSLYATGNFTNIGGVAANRVAKWNGTVWAALSTGLNDIGFAICAAPNGQIYVGGQFTTAGGVTVNRIARWDGISWNTITGYSTIGFPAGIVYAIENGIDGNTIYIGGSLNYSGILNSLVSCNLTTNAVTGVTSFNNPVYCLAVGSDGKLYIGGSFTSNSNGTTTWKRIVVWNGSADVSQLGNGFDDGTVYALRFLEDGSLIAGGNFTLSGSLSLLRLALWNTGIWNNMDVIPAKIGSPIVYSLCVLKESDILLGLSGMAVATYASYQNIVNNPSTKEVQPRIYISGYGVVKFIENLTTKKRIYLNLTLYNNDEIFFDFGKGEIRNNRGNNYLWTLLPNSNFSDFSLSPGENLINVFMVDDVNGFVQIECPLQHWSVDSTVGN